MLLSVLHGCRIKDINVQMGLYDIFTGINITIKFDTIEEYMVVLNYL